MTNYKRWIFDTIAPFLGERVLEAGCGSGNLASFVIQSPRVRHYVGIEKLPELCSAIKNNLKPGGDQTVEILNGDLEGNDLAGLAERPFDTIICLNVLEHIDDDQKLLSLFEKILKPEGTILLLVPAFQWLYGSIDRVIDHYRRYSRKELAGKLKNAGFIPVRIRYFNACGILGWLWHGKIRRLAVHPSGDMKMWDSLVPILKKIEGTVPMPFGLSIFASAKKSRIR